MSVIASAKPNRIYFEHLDLIRFIAAFSIIILHSYEGWIGQHGELGFLSGGTYTDLTSTGVYVDQFIRNLGIGVDIFFLLSGFLITYILLEEKKRFNSISIGKFIIRRTIRIWPLYFFIIAISPLIVDWMGYTPPNYLANSLFIGNFEIINSKSWVFPFAHFWSICIEEHFYLVWPFIIAFIPVKRMLPIFFLIIFGSIAFRMYSYWHLDSPWYTLFLHTFSRIDVLVIGAIGAYFYSIKPFTVKLPRIVRYALIGILCAILMLDSVVLWDGIYTAGFKKYASLSIIAVLILDFNFNPNFKHIIKPGSIFHYFGKISYGIYMYGNILVMIVLDKIINTFEIGNAYVYFAIIFGLSIAVPIISYELFEKHVLKLNVRFRRIETKR